MFHSFVWFVHKLLPHRWAKLLGPVYRKELNANSVLSCPGSLSVGPCSRGEWYTRRRGEVDSTQGKATNESIPVDPRRRETYPKVNQTPRLHPKQAICAVWWHWDRNILTRATSHCPYLGPNHSMKNCINLSPSETVRFKIREVVCCKFNPESPQVFQWVNKLELNL